MATGTVKWFSDAKGYGFIEPDGEAGKDIFAHFSAIQMDGFRTLRMGSRVSYELHDGPKGLHAQQIAPPERHRQSLGRARADSLRAVHGTGSCGQSRADPRIRRPTTGYAAVLKPGRSSRQSPHEKTLALQECQGLYRT